MTEPGGGPYVEAGASWRPCWLVAAALAGLVVLDTALPGSDAALLACAAAVAAVLGIVAVGTLSARRAWTVRVDGEHLTVGHESVRLPDIDAGHLGGVAAGVDAGAPVLGGGWSVPKGRTGLPLRLADGRSVLVPTRDPAALRTALLSSQGTLEP